MKRYLFFGACIMTLLYSCATLKTERKPQECPYLISFFYSDSLMQYMRQTSINKGESLEIHLINGTPYTSFIDSVYKDARLVARIPYEQATFTSITFYGYTTYYWYPHVVPRAQKRTL